MSEPFVFDSRCELCKYPYGAAVCGTSVILHVRPLAREGFVRCTVTLRSEFAGSSRELELVRDGTDGDRDRFSLTFQVPEEPELVWYAFRFFRPDGTACGLDRTGYRTDGPLREWQLTVYRKSRSPAWFREGITYQIFPDRFCRLSAPDPAGLVGDRTVHADWDEEPDWRPDAAGEIRNRDFFGGSLAGITAHLDQLAELGVTTLYLNPIFESASNHRYNTADYRRIDPMLGTEEDFRALCGAARSRGIRVILDGVFNHTGSQSRYFNADGFYPDPGAAQSKDSPYYPWYTFSHWPDRYDAWWGIRTLPAVNESAPDYRAFIAGAEDSVVRRWLRAGASGWRLDVADELPDEFIASIRSALDETVPDGVLLGEVWEDGSNKISYSRRRRYLLGSEVHGLMNYPFRTAALAWLQGGDAAAFCEAMETLRENYPPAAFACAMNFLGTHDTPRILTVLGSRAVPTQREARAAARLSPEEYARGAALERLAAALLFAFPGSPTIYYGDEVGMQGFEDPFNRRTYPWGREDVSLRAFYAVLGRLRGERVSLRRGDLRWLYAAGPGLAFSREAEGESTLSVFNAGGAPLSLSLPWVFPTARDALTGRPLLPAHDRLSLTLGPREALLVTE
jgi:4-alpha-glucanotransferase